MKWKNMVPLLAGVFAFAGCMAYLKRDRKQDVPKEEDALEDYLAHYEETWKEDGKNCKYIVRNNRGVLVKIEKIGENVHQSVLDEEEKNALKEHVKENVWPIGAPYSRTNKGSACGMCRFHNGIELYVPEHLLFKGLPVD